MASCFNETVRNEGEIHITRKLTPEISVKVDALFTDLIGAMADKWTMVLLEVLGQHGKQRYSELRHRIPAISQKMLTQTLRRMERNGFVTREVHPVVPPRVEYAVTDLGVGSMAAFNGVWTWAAENLSEVERARIAFSE